MQTAASSHPAAFAFDPPDKVANWRPLVNWLLAIPHLAITYALGVVSEILSVISWFSILFTGKIPEGIANFQVLYLRYSLRATTYALFMRNEYPPFTFDMTPSDPGDDQRVRVDVRPELDNRNRLTTAFRIFLIIPLVIVAAVYFIGMFFVMLIAFFAVLFTGRWPAGMLNFVVRVERYWLRVQTYAMVLTDRYPSFALEDS